MDNEHNPETRTKRTFRGDVSNAWNSKPFKPVRWLVCTAAKDPKDGNHQTERVAVRLGVPVLLVISLVGAIRISADTNEAPNVAFGNHVVFAAQLAILIFYSLLLALVPLVRALAGGELPVELTLKGPRYTERALEDSKKADDELTQRVTAFEHASEYEVSLVAEAIDEVIEDLENQRKEIERLKW